MSITMIALPGTATGLPSSVGDRLAGQRDVDRLDRADVGAGDPDLLALDHEGAVVEDRPNQVAAAAAAAGDEQDDRDDGRHQRCRDYQSPRSWSGRRVGRVAFGGVGAAAPGRVDERVGAVGGLLGGAAGAAPVNRRRGAEGVELLRLGDRFERCRLRSRRGSGRRSRRAA